MFTLLNILLTLSTVVPLKGQFEEDFTTTEVIEVTDDYITDDSGCEFDGQRYYEFERLPGCFKVYCIQGQWLEKGYIDPDCSQCYAIWDPHMRTFDGYYYDFHGTCNYSLAQNGDSVNPDFGFFNEFYSCWGGGTCVGQGTYKDNPNTVIEIGVDGVYYNDLYTLYVNGDSYDVTSYIPQLITVGGVQHPVFAWRYGAVCIRLIGSSGIAVQRCNYETRVWATLSLMGTLGGLCGSFDGNSNNDFAHRDGSSSALTFSPAGTGFPSSWEASCPNGVPGRHRRSTTPEADGTCTLDDTTVMDTLEARCNVTVSATEGIVDDTQYNALLDACLYDVCTISKNTSTAAAIDTYLGNIGILTEVINDITIKTTSEDPIPEPPTTTTALSTMESTEMSYPHSDSHHNKCGCPRLIQMVKFIIHKKK